MIFMPDLDWKHVIGAQVYYPLSLGVEYFTDRPVLGAIIGLVAVVLVWLALSEIDFLKLRRHRWVQEQLDFRA